MPFYVGSSTYLLSAIFLYPRHTKIFFGKQNFSRITTQLSKKKAWRYLNSVKLLIFLNLTPRVLLSFVSRGSFFCYVESKRNVILIRTPSIGFFEGRVYETRLRNQISQDRSMKWMRKKKENLFPWRFHHNSSFFSSWLLWLKKSKSNRTRWRTMCLNGCYWGLPAAKYSI